MVLCVLGLLAEQFYTDLDSGWLLVSLPGVEARTQVVM